MRGVLTGYRPLTISSGYHGNFDGATLANGDRCTGHVINEGGRLFFVCQSQSGDEYETAEMPCIRLDFTNAVHVAVVLTAGFSPNDS